MELAFWEIGLGLTTLDRLWQTSTLSVHFDFRNDCCDVLSSKLKAGLVLAL